MAALNSNWGRRDPMDRSVLTEHTMLLDVWLVDPGNSKKLRRPRMTLTVEVLSGAVVKAKLEGNPLAT